MRAMADARRARRAATLRNPAGSGQSGFPRFPPGPPPGHGLGASESPPQGMKPKSGPCPCAAPRTPRAGRPGRGPPGGRSGPGRPAPAAICRPGPTDRARTIGAGSDTLRKCLGAIPQPIPRAASGTATHTPRLNLMAMPRSFCGIRLRKWTGRMPGREVLGRALGEGSRQERIGIVGTAQAQSAHRRSGSDGEGSRAPS